eukprot:gb/GEZN01000660.1/.p1 GENE.gb/GEZN01000660.1/~~gb/GEZN01000660.1/.p1  ORF type:complete len:1240 (-),score=215.56 gb/GEZN01000660.1/:187-3660(-)
MFASGDAAGKLMFWGDKLSTKVVTNEVGKQEQKTEMKMKIIKTLQLPESVQCMAFNPVSNFLAVGTLSELYVFNTKLDASGKLEPSTKSQKPIKTGSKVCSVAWSLDGNYLACGLFDGRVTIRNKAGLEDSSPKPIKRNGPVWCLAFAKLPLGGDLLAVGSWDQTLSFYQTNGMQPNKYPDRQLDFDPCSLSFFTKENFLLVGGSNRKVGLYTKQGIFLREVAERKDWIWGVKAQPRSNSKLAVCCNDGALSLFYAQFSTVHGLHQDRYATRDGMTDVVIHNLTAASNTEQKVRIRTNDYVKKIAVYRDQLAVQLPECIFIYESNSAAGGAMNYQIKERIHRKFDCNLLVVTGSNLILCEERRLELLSFKGEHIREWVLEAAIRYIRVIGGPKGKEGLLVGLKSGAVLKIFLTNQYPVRLLKHPSAVKCLDLSCDRQKLALVDASSKIYVYDLGTQEVEFEENGAHSVAYNTEIPDLLCYSNRDSGQLSIRLADHPVSSQPQQAQSFVVGFIGSKIFCLHYLNMNSLEVPQGRAMHHFLSHDDFGRAYQVACLGVTRADWQEMALRSLSQLELSVAKKAFARVQDMRYVDLIKRIEIARTAPDASEDLFKAQVLAYQGDYDAAARYFTAANQHKQAIEMFLDLRDWQRAKRVVQQYEEDFPAEAASEGSMNSLLIRQAQWLTETNEPKGAADMYWAAGDYRKAIAILQELGDLDVLMEKARALDEDTQREEILLCGSVFGQAAHYEYTKETFNRIGATKEFLLTLVQLKRWEEAFAVASQHKELTEAAYYPHAEFLVAHDQFEEAQKAYFKANRPDKALGLVKQLMQNSVTEHKFEDAGYYYYLVFAESLNKNNLASVESGLSDLAFGKVLQMLRRAELYFAYNFIYRYVTEPYTTMQTDALFCSAVYLLHATQLGTPYGVSNTFLQFAVAKLASKLDCPRLAATAFSTLLRQKIPASWRDEIELGHLMLKNKTGAVDSAKVAPLCYRCGTRNALVPDGGSQSLRDQYQPCSACGASLIRSFSTFQVLPLVEFEVIGATDADMLDMLSKPRGGDAVTLPEEMDPFFQQLGRFKPSLSAEPIKLTKEQVYNFPQGEVFSISWPLRVKPVRYFRNIVPELRLSLCDNCQHFFHQTNYEAHQLRFGHCPFCRNSSLGLNF